MRRIEEELQDGFIVRQATYNDIPSIMSFIKKYWKEDHIFATNRDYFEYEFLHDNNEVSFVLLCDGNGEIRGTLGYIPYSYCGKRNIFTVMWKVVNDGENIFGGIKLFYFIVDNCLCNNIYTIGLNTNTISIYKYLKLSVVKMKHYYIVNESKEQHLSIGAQPSLLISTGNQLVINEDIDVDVLKDNFHKLEQKDNIYKSLEYIVHRYYYNPFYSYKNILAIKNYKMALVILREQTCGESKILRFIDCIGNVELIYEIPFFLRNELDDDYEYIDMYSFGLDDERMKSAGWNLVVDDTTVIPNYFNPFEQKNIDIYAMHEKELTPVFFKGDGDQDRP